jgi:cell division septum initiation protein DivIVA
LFKAIAARSERAGRIWRGHLVQDVPNTTAARRTAGIGGGMFAILTVLVVTICAGALVAITQIKSLQTEIASLKRELLPLRERLAKHDQAEKAKEAEITAAAEKSKALTQNRSEQAPLTFSREEVQLIREYIKPAPFAGPAAPAVSVGDPVTSGTIPFPSPLTEKVPKLLGSRFAIRNGAIIIVRKDSRQADAVLAPY